MPRWTVRVVAVLLGAALGIGSPLPSGALAADREDLEIVVKPREPRPDVFVLKGRVKPDYAGKAAILQRRNCGDCTWFSFERFRTDDASRFKIRVPTPAPEDTKKVCYRVKIPRSDKFRRAISISNCIGGVEKR